MRPSQASFLKPNDQTFSFFVVSLETAAADELLGAAGFTNNKPISYLCNDLRFSLTYRVRLGGTRARRALRRRRAAVRHGALAPRRAGARSGARGARGAHAGALTLPTTPTRS